MTALRFACVKTSANRAFAAVRGDSDAALVFFGSSGTDSVVDARPLRIARVELFVSEFAGICAPPRLGGEAPQDPRPAALRIIVAVGMLTGINVGEGAPCAGEDPLPFLRCQGVVKA